MCLDVFSTIKHDSTLVKKWVSFESSAPRANNQLWHYTIFVGGNPRFHLPTFPAFSKNYDHFKQNMLTNQSTPTGITSGAFQPSPQPAGYLRVSQIKDIMKTFQEECFELAQLETFDPLAFQADETVSQDLCNIILTLALIYNDCKNLIYAYLVTAQFRPEGKFVRNRLWGAFSGVQFHIFRAIIGLLHELFNLIRNNESLLQQPFFKSVIHQIDTPAKKAWDTVVAVALGNIPSDELGKSLLLVRNKISFHYDGKAIFIGYKHHFLKSDHLDERAFISRGNSMKESRFYFADAAALGYLRSIVGQEKIEELIIKIGDLLDPVNHSLMAIVNAYIQKRGFAYRLETEKIG